MARSPADICWNIWINGNAHTARPAVAGGRAADPPHAGRQRLSVKVFVPLWEEEMEYVKVLTKAELANNQMKVVSAGGKDILLVNVEGAYYAIENTCTHAGGSLGNGKLSGNVITCPRHGAEFDVKTGKNIGEAKLGFIKLKVKDERAYAIKIEGEDILVGIP
jgi:3-phenylpropionate/trans-cinnamate dioxygenase ferredoxin subunit